MITFAFDESGNFEIPKLDDTLLIGGVLYDDTDDPNDTDNERKRLASFYSSVCNRVGAEYPRHLHQDRNYKDYDHDMLKKVKAEISAQLPEFLQKGTINDGQPLYSVPRIGKYYPFVFLKGSNGKYGLRGENLNKLTRDDFASNLYIHMAEDTIIRMIFHNPIINISSVRFDLATRVAHFKNVSAAKEQEYTDLGHGHNNIDNSNWFYITSTDLFRTTIEREMLYSEQQSLKVEEISAKSIDYGNTKTDMGFLYMADILCSLLCYELKHVDEIEKPEKIKSSLCKLTGNENNLIFVYDDIDTYYDKAIRCFENGDYYHAYSYIYDGAHCSSEYVEFYEKNWFRILKDMLEKETDYGMFSIAVDYLDNYAHSNKIDQNKLMNIATGFCEMAEYIKFPNEEDKKTLFILYDITASACNHMGYSQKADENVKKANKYIKYMDIPYILRNKHKQVVRLCDILKYDEALELAETTCECARNLYDIRKNLLPDDNEESLEYAISLSQLGQVYGYMRDSRAQEAFNQSLSLFVKDSPNYKITQSYLLHFYIDNAMKDQYDQLMQEYTEGTTDLRIQLLKIMEMGSKERGALVSVKFALYCYIKGLYVFHLQELSEELINDLADLRIKLINAGYEDDALNDHPWQLINKYRAFILFQKGRIRKAEQLMDNISIEGGPIIEAIIAFGEAQYAELKNDSKTRDAKAKTAFEKIASKNHDIEAGDPASYYNSMKDIITYTYV